MENPYKINLRNAFVTCLIGIAMPLYQGGLFEIEFLYFVGGFILLISTPAIKKENVIIAHLAVLITLFLIGLATYQLISDYQDYILSPLNIGRFIIILMNTIATVFYVKRFIYVSKLKKQEKTGQ